jgi:hypothetical protein
LPDFEINEQVLAERIILEITPENLTPLVTANFLLAMDAHDRRLTRNYFEDVLVMTFNFQNRLVRLAELGNMVAAIAQGKDLMTEVKSDIARHIASAKSHQQNLLNVLKLFREMRGKEDSVS